MDTRYCTFCKEEREIILLEDQYVCKLCGFVVEKKINWVHGYEAQSNSTMETSLYDGRPTISLSKDNMGKKINLKMASSLLKTLQRTRVNTTCGRNRLKGLLEIERLSKLLDISPYIQNIIIEKYVEFNDKGFLKNKNIYSCVAGLLSIIVNIHDIPIPVSEILKNSVISKKKFNQDYFYLFHLFDKASPTSAKMETHISKYISYVKDWPEYESFKKILDEALQVTQVKLKIGREGIVITGTLIYVLLKHFKYPYLEEILNLLLLNRLTLKNCWNTLVQEHPYLKVYSS